MTEAGERAVAGVPPPGHRLPDGTRVGRVRLQVADLERSLRFYGDVIGLGVLARDPGRATLGSRDDGTALLELVERPGARRVPPRGLLGLYHFALLLPTRADLGRFVRRQSELATPFGASDHHFSEATYLVDPDGITIEVYADRPRREWTYRRGEFAVASDPLDLRSLVGEGGDRRWAGVPAGSVIGHVHFYVGDIPAAEAFYHTGLGFDKTIWTFPGALFVGAGGYHHHVGLNTWAAGMPVATDEDARLLDWELVVPDAAALAAAARALADAGHEPRPREGGGFVAGDPWGITVCAVPEAS